ncbi:MAG: hypothetical protein IT233_12385 [Bacteroidia bacterium]|nr:hypothetical protein [Bacteroidia bacterium]
MLLIAESGGTRTRWILTDKRKTLPLDGHGLNPNSVDHRLIKKELSRIAKRIRKYSVDEVIFYGAGCGRSAPREQMMGLLSAQFPAATISVYTDLEAAAAGMLGNRSGYIGILGTGSNAGYFSGKKITRTTGAGGFPAGDHGSGAWMGLRMVQDAETGRMPLRLVRAWKPAIRKSFSDKQPAAALARLAKLAGKKRKDAYVRSLLLEAFVLYHSYYLKPLRIRRNSVLALTGGIAWNFRTELRSFLRRKGFTLLRFYPDPVEGLIRYHRYLLSRRK